MVCVFVAGIGMADVVDLDLVRRTRRAAGAQSLPNLIGRAAALTLLASASWLLTVAVLGAVTMTAMASAVTQD
jgi:hypothetical protein